MTFAWVPSRGVLIKLDDADLMESAEVFESLGGVITEDDLAAVDLDDDDAEEVTR